MILYRALTPAAKQDLEKCSSVEYIEKGFFNFRSGNLDICLLSVLILRNIVDQIKADIAI